MPRPRAQEDLVREQLLRHDQQHGSTGADPPGSASETPPAAAAGEPAGPEPDGPAGGPPAAEGAPATPEPQRAAEVEPAAEAEAPAVTEVERQRDEYLALAQRTQADFENYRRRAARDVAAATTRAKSALVRELLPAVDNLERALAAAGEAEASLASGVRLVHADLVGVLRRNGVEAVEPAGERFDPTVHEAISTRPADGAEPGLVVDVVEKGYRLGDAVIRPARVVVSE